MLWVRAPPGTLDSVFPLWYDAHASGDVAKWQGRGLQNPDHGFESRRRLKNTAGLKEGRPLVCRSSLVNRLSAIYGAVEFIL